MVFCKGGHEIIQKLLDKSEDISVQIRFNYRDFRADENFKSSCPNYMKSI